jgi:hypothetical protein
MSPGIVKPFRLHIQHPHNAEHTGHDRIARKIVADLDHHSVSMHSYGIVFSLGGVSPIELRKYVEVK